MNKRVYAFLLALCLVLNMFSGIAIAEETPVVPAPEETPVDPWEGHSKGVVKTTASTCKAEGVKEEYCADEDCEFFSKPLVSTPIEKAEHEVCLQECDIDFTEPTCTEKGNNFYHCVECGIHMKKAADGVTFEVCDGDHSDKKGCEVCYVAAIGHEYETFEAEAATCTKAGHNFHVICTNVIDKDDEGNDIICGDAKDGHDKVVYPALGHDYENAVPNDDFEPYCKAGEEDGTGIIDSVPGYCPVCDAELNIKIEIPAAPHKWVEVPAKAATCKEEGHTAYKYCSACDWVVGKEILETTEDHKWVDVDALAATCTEDGHSKGLKCSVCGISKPGKGGCEVIPALGHSYGNGEANDANNEDALIEKQPTCTEKGKYADLVCEHVIDGKVCGAVDEGEEIPATGHDYSIVHYGKKATCTEPGVGANLECSVCGDMKYDEAVIPAHGHSTENGYYPQLSDAQIAEIQKALKEYKKIDWDGTFKGAPGDARVWETDGIESFYTVEKAVAVSCTQNGYVPAKYCTFCLKPVTEAETIQKWNHIATEEQKKDGLKGAHVIDPIDKPTCTEEGTSDEWKCDLCGAEWGGDTINALGHDMIDVPVAAVLPTCDKPGNFAFSYCTREGCGYAVAEAQELEENKVIVNRKSDGTVEYLKIKLEEDVVLNNFNKDHYEDHGFIRVEFSIPAYRHAYNGFSFLEDLTPIAPTCTENGLAEGATRCQCCNELFGVVVLEALGHEMKHEDGKAPTCTDEGVQEHVYCERCGKACVAVNGAYSVADWTNSTLTKDSDWTIAALGHNPVPGVAKEATCIEAGHKAGLYCDREGCGITIEKQEVVPALGHDFSDLDEKGFAPGCVTKGQYDLMGCVRCDATKWACECDKAETEEVEECTCKGEIPAHGHYQSDVVAAKTATCTEPGYTEGYHCVKCPINYEPVYNYLMGIGNVSAADLYDQGWIGIPDLVPARKHDKMTAPVTKAATCEEVGYDNYRECTYDDCDHTTGKILPALGHKTITVPGGEQTAPTCTQAGSAGLEQCTRCMKIMNKATAALGHDWKLVEEVEATCAAKGNIEYEICARCELIRIEGEEKGFDIKQVKTEDDGEHDDLRHETAKLPTCEVPGYSEGQKCYVCNWTNCTEIAPDAKVWHKWIVDNEEQAIADGHAKWVTTSEYDENKPGSGIKSLQCTGCHNYVATKLWPEVKLGDVNMDGYVDTWDALMIMQWEVGIVEKLTNEKVGDFNGDTFVDTWDALDILNAEINGELF